MRGQGSHVYNSHSKQVGGFQSGGTPVFVSDYRRAREALKALEGG